MPRTQVDRIDGFTTAIGLKAPCVCATTANITLAGLQTIDGITLVDTYPPDRVLVKDQTDATENGIYNPADGGRAWTRALDFDGFRDVTDGTLVWVQHGDTNQGLWKTICADRTVIVDTSELTFALVWSLTGAITFPIDIYFEGKPSAGELYPIRNTVIAFRLPANLAGSSFTVHPSFLPTATATFTVYKNFVSIGTIAFATSGVPTITFVSDVDFSLLDKFSITGPGSQDATMENVSLNFLAQIVRL